MAAERAAAGHTTADPAGDGPTEQPCCPSGCDECSLSCCSGAPPALVLASDALYSEPVVVRLSMGLVLDFDLPLPEHAFHPPRA